MGKGKHGVEASVLAVGVSGAICKKFREHNQAVEFVKACQASQPREVLLDHDENPPEGSSNWTVKGTNGHAQPVKFSRARRTIDPADRIVVHDNGPPSGSEWCAVVNGKHGVCNVFMSWSEASKFFLGSPGALVEKFATPVEALAFLSSSW